MLMNLNQNRGRIKTFPAQVGVATVLLAVVLLSIAVSVSFRVSEQVMQETARQESSQLTNEAESIVSTVSDVDEGEVADQPLVDNITGSYEGTENNVNVDVERVVTSGREDNDDTFDNTASVPDTIFLQAGETVSVDLRRVDLGKQIVYWELLEQKLSSCDDKAALLLSHIPANGREAEYYSISPVGCTGRSQWTGYIEASAGVGIKFANQVSLVSVLTTANEGTLRIKVLYNSTYLSINGLTDILRAAAGSGNQVSVVEQNKTVPAPPHFSDFSIFAGDGQICQVIPGGGFTDCH
jgi:hypothetical protein